MHIRTLTEPLSSFSSTTQVRSLDSQYTTINYIL